MLRDLVQSKLVVNLGTGGVGKTTLSVLLAMSAAKLGKRTVIVTIDPSKRLAQLLGLDPVGGSQPEPIELQINGETLQFAGFILNSKMVFDEFVMECAPSRELAHRMIENKLYQQLSTTLSASQDFTSLQAIYGLMKSNDYDLIILDTPPSHHTLDFFESPLRISSLFESSIFENLHKLRQKKSLFSKIFSSGTERALDVLRFLTGSEFVDNLKMFFEVSSSMRLEIAARSHYVNQLLKSEDTKFSLVMNWDPIQVHEGKDLIQKLSLQGLKVSMVFANRSAPLWYHSLRDQPDFPRTSFVDYFQAREKNFYDTMESLFSADKIMSLPQFDRDLNQLSDLGESLQFLADKEVSE